jgi:hypothetical protein
MPPVTRVMVSRPLESPRKSAYTQVRLFFFPVLSREAVYSRGYGPEIGNVDEGVVERSEYSGYAEDEFTWRR